MKLNEVSVVLCGLLVGVSIAGLSGCGGSSDSSGDGYTLSTTPPVAGATVTVASGSDPDVAVDGNGDLHFAYVRDGVVWYTKFDYASGAVLIPEVAIGGGDDPQIAVDSRNNPHVVFGNMFYAYWTGSGFSAPVILACDKGRPRISVDSADRVWIAGMRGAGDRDQLFMFENNALAINGITIGGNDLGSIDIDSSGRVHVCWRSGRDLFYTSYLGGEDATGISARSINISGSASDFSDLVVDNRDGSVHVTHTHSYGSSIDYLYRDAAGNWSSDTLHAWDQVTGASDVTQPTIACDRDGYKYIAFTGSGAIPRYFVIGRDGTEIVSSTTVDSTTSGGKKQNPNVSSRPDMSGAYVTWGTGTVRVRALGSVSL
ncbi:MAG: hypothetical protein WCL44_10825 [bacterium]